jgi:hypothetical protein
MKTLLEIYDPTTSDKGTNHSYIEHIYEDLFSKYRNSADAVLEIGTYEGGSLYMWKEYFTKAKIYGIESFKRVDIIDERITQLIANAYTESTVNLLDENFDIIIDDGPHSGESQKLCIELYLEKLKDGGIMIIEDISGTEVLDGLISCIPNGLEFKVFDLRHLKNRWDDLVLVIKK